MHDDATFRVAMVAITVLSIKGEKIIGCLPSRPDVNPMENRYVSSEDEII